MTLEQIILHLKTNNVRAPWRKHGFGWLDIEQLNKLPRDKRIAVNKYVTKDLKWLEVPMNRYITPYALYMKEVSGKLNVSGYSDALTQSDVELLNSLKDDLVIVERFSARTHSGKTLPFHQIKDLVFKKYLTWILKKTYKVNLKKL